MLTFEKLQKIVNRKEYADARQRAIKRKNLAIYRRIVLDGWAYTLLMFNKAKKAHMETYNAKRSLILFDEFIIALDGPTPEKVDFNTIWVFNINEGTIDKRISTDFGICDKKDIVIVDEHLLVIKQKEHPRFAVIINGRLTEIPSVIAVEIMRLPQLSSSHQASLQSFYAKENWEVHNNLLINPNRCSVPSMTDLTFFSKNRPNSQMLKKVKRLDFKLMEVALSYRKEDKSVITNLRSETLRH